MYFYFFREQTDLLKDKSQILNIDFLDAIQFAINHKKENPTVAYQRLVNRQLEDVCVFSEIM